MSRVGFGQFLRVLGGRFGLVSVASHAPPPLVGVGVLVSLVPGRPAPHTFEGMRVRLLSGFS